MRRSRFSVNALVLIVIIFSAMAYFVTVTLTGLADRSAVNDYYPVEGTDLAIRYSSLQPDGLYEGGENTGVLRVEGTFGYDWGIARVGDRLYLNEYTASPMGLLLCDLVCVDLNTFEKQVLAHDTILRGRCKSGELVCMGGTMLPTNAPSTNSLCRFYALSDPKLNVEMTGADVLFLDPETAEVKFATYFDPDAPGGDFSARYLERSLEEVQP